MKFWWRLAVAGLAVVWLGGFASVVRTAAQAQMTAPPAGKKAGEFFKNVSTSTLKELSIDDFIKAMGVIADDLGLDCADCHPNAGTDEVDWVIDTTRKRTARRMVEMVATINRTNFPGVQKVTCWTCHHGRDVPASTIALDNLYDTPNSEKDDIVKARDRRADRHPDPRQIHRGARRRPAAGRPQQLCRHRREPRVHGVGRHRRLQHLRESAESESHDHQVQGPPGPGRKHLGLQRHQRLDQDAARPVQRGGARRRRAGRGQTGSPVGLPRADQTSPDQLARRPEAAHRRSRLPGRPGNRPQEPSGHACTSTSKRDCSCG